MDLNRNKKKHSAYFDFDFKIRGKEMKNQAMNKKEQT